MIPDPDWTGARPVPTTDLARLRELQKQILFVRRFQGAAKIDLPPVLAASEDPLPLDLPIARTEKPSTGVSSL